MSNQDLVLEPGVDVFTPLSLIEKAANLHGLIPESGHQFSREPIPKMSLPICAPVKLSDCLPKIKGQGFYDIDLYGIQGNNVRQDGWVLRINKGDKYLEWYNEGSPSVTPSFKFSLLIRFEIDDESGGIRFHPHIGWGSDTDSCSVRKKDREIHLELFRLLASDIGESLPEVVRPILFGSVDSFLVVWGCIGLPRLKESHQVWEEWGQRKVFLGDILRITHRRPVFDPHPFPFIEYRRSKRSKIFDQKRVYRYYTPRAQEVIKSRWKNQLDLYMEEQYSLNDDED